MSEVPSNGFSCGRKSRIPPPPLAPTQTDTLPATVAVPLSALFSELQPPRLNISQAAQASVFLTAPALAVPSAWILFPRMSA